MAVDTWACVGLPCAGHAEEPHTLRRLSRRSPPPLRGRHRDGTGHRPRSKVAIAAVGAVAVGFAGGAAGFGSSLTNHGFAAPSWRLRPMTQAPPLLAPAGSGGSASSRSSLAATASSAVLPTAAVPATALPAAQASASSAPLARAVACVAAGALASWRRRTTAGALRRRRRQRQRTVLAATGVARRASESENGGFLRRLRRFFSRKTGDKKDVDGEACVAADGVRLIVNSQSSAGQHLCGLYEELDAALNGRSIYKKIGVTVGDPVFLLYNTAGQWAFTPHIDGRPDGWAFADATAAAGVPQTIPDGRFHVWDGNAWVTDASLAIKAEGAVERPAAVVAEAARDAASELSEAERVAAAGLPEEAQDLSVLSFPAHWVESQRCLFSWDASASTLAARRLQEHPGLRRGVLKNGLRYVVMTNGMPPGRFEAHLELHVGSVDEEPHEQGIAHMMEHVCFLGSRKRERLVGTGSRSNALTDFQHTIYHIHSPNRLEDGREMYLPALEALQEIAFCPELRPERIEKERKAVLAEMQQVNDMEYRMETWTLSGLHETNKLGTQFPIGKEEQIKSWKQKDLQAFHEKWYYPGNATLYVIGDLSEEAILDGIQKVFASVPARHEVKPGVAVEAPIWGEESADARSLFRRRIGRPRPEQLHNFSVPMIGTEDSYTPASCFEDFGGQPRHGSLRIFRSELLEGLQLNFYAKAPVRPLRTLEDIRYLVAVRVLVGVLQFRIVSRYSSNHAPVQVDHSDSFREGCAVTSLTVNADPRDWQNALGCVVQEVRALCDYGITQSELKRYLAAMLKDVEKGVSEDDSVPSEDHLNFIMTSDVFDHVVMHPEASYEAFKEVAPTVTKELVHEVAKWMLGFLGHYGKAAAPPPTAIVVCTPTQVYEEATNQWTPFDITEDEITELLLTVPDKSESEALSQVDVPDSLLSGHLEKLLASKPVDAFTAWRTLHRKRDESTGIVQMLLPNGARVNYVSTANESQGTMRLLVPGGRSTDGPDEVGASMVGIRTISESGAVSTFSREQIELFAVSNLASVHLDLSLEFSYIDASFTVGDKGLVAVLEMLHLLFREPRWELPAFMRAQQAYKVQASAVRKSLEQSTLDRLMRAMYAGDRRIVEPDIEDLNRLTLAKVRSAISRQLRPQDLEINLVADFEGRAAHRRQAAVEGALSTGKHRDGGEVVDVVDEKEVPEALREKRFYELEEELWRHLGTLPPSELEPEATTREPAPPQLCLGGASASDARASGPPALVAHLEDSDERAVANIGGGAPNRWGKGDAYHSEIMAQRGFTWNGSPASAEISGHALYPSVCLLILREVINTRLFSTVRDSLGLSYDCSFELSMLDRLEAGWFVCTVSAHPSRIQEAVDAAKGVLSGLRSQPVSELELASARRTLLRRHEAELQTNEYWISLLTHLQYDNPKDLSCVRDIEMLLQALSRKDVQHASEALLLEPEQLFVSLTTAGPGGGPLSAAVAAGSAAAPDRPGATRRKRLVEVD